MAKPTRNLLIFVSDIHLTEQPPLGGVPRAALFERFWTRIADARGEVPAHLVFVGDLFDIVRSPRWFAGPHRPYHPPNLGQMAVVDQIIAEILRVEAAFFTAMRLRVQAGVLQVSTILGNHDRLLAFAPKSRRLIWQALTGVDREVDFADEMVFPQHGVLAYHGNRADFMCYMPDNAANMGDAIGSELIVRLPMLMRAKLGVELPELDEIDDVRPIFAVPSWVRHFGTRREGMMDAIAKSWRELVDDFLENPFLDEWTRQQDSHGASEARKLKLLLTLSNSRLMRKTSDHRLVQVYQHLQQYFDGRFAKYAADLLQSPGYYGLRHVVNGHSHFASMVPLGLLRGRPATYFNTGSWRTVHQMGRLLDGRPAFLKYEAMSYLVFFPDGDLLGREFEWWTGALVPTKYTQVHE